MYNNTYSFKQELASLQGKEIHYKCADLNNSDKNLIMIHGLASSLDIFDNILPVLAVNFRVISYDMRGHSKSKKVQNSNYSVDEHANDLKDLMDYLNINKAYIIGHSMGGRVALQFLKLFPDRVVKGIIYDQNIRPQPNFQLSKIAKQFESFKNENFVYNNQKDLNKALKRCKLPNFYREKYVINEDGKLQIDWDPEVSLKCLEIQKLDLTEVVQEIKCPMLFLKSDLAEIPFLFRLFAQSYWNKEFKYIEGLGLDNVKIERIKGSGHLIHKSHPEAFAKAVKDFCN